MTKHILKKDSVTPVCQHLLGSGIWYLFKGVLSRKEKQRLSGEKKLIVQLWNFLGHVENLYHLVGNRCGEKVHYAFYVT